MEPSDQLHTVTALVADGPPYTLLGVGLSLGEGLNAVMRGSEPQFPGYAAHSLVTMPTEQSRFY
jgi:hypothetical protein